MAETVEIVFGSDDLARGVEDGLRCDERRELGLAARGFRERFRRWRLRGPSGFRVLVADSQVSSWVLGGEGTGYHCHGLPRLYSGSQEDE